MEVCNARTAFARDNRRAELLAAEQGLIPWRAATPHTAHEPAARTSRWRTSIHPNISQSPRKAAWSAARSWPSMSSTRLTNRAGAALGAATWTL